MAKELPPLSDKEFEVLEELIKLIILKPTVKVHIKVEIPSLGKFKPEEVIKYLDSLAKKGYVESKIIDRILSCPQCGGLNIITKYTCPKCGNINITKTNLIQHKVCGYVDTEVKFEKEGRLICPKCNVVITERSNITILASLFECLVCGYRTSTPNIIHKCGDCETMFSPRQANYIPIHGYELRDEILELITSRETLLKTVKSVTSDLGIEVKTNPSSEIPLSLTMGDEQIDIDVIGRNEHFSDVKLRVARSKGNKVILVQSNSDDRDIQENLKEMPNVQVIKLSDLRKLLNELILKKEK